MKRYTFNYATLKIIKLDKKYHNSFHFDNINFWPLIRNILYNSFLKSDYLSESSSGKNFFLSFFKFYSKEILRVFIYNISNYIFNNKNNKENIFFCSKKSIYVANNTKYFDIIADPIIFNLKKKYSKLYLDNFNYFKPYFFPVSFWGVLFPLKINKNYIPNNIKILIIKICNDEGLNVK